MPRPRAHDDFGWLVAFLCVRRSAERAENQRERNRKTQAT
jgi:hypothetical protein